MALVGLSRSLVKSPFNSWSIKDRVAAAVAVLFMVAVAVSSALQNRGLREDFTRVLAEEQYALVKRTAHDIDAKFAACVSALAGTAAFIRPADLAQPAQLREQFHERPSLMSFFDDVIVLGPDGIGIVDYPEVPGRANVNASDRSFFKEVVRTHQSVISEPLRGKTSGEPIVQVATPILTRDDKLLGVVLGVIRLYRDSFLGALGEERIGTGGYFALITRGPKPIYVAHPDRARIMTERVQNNQTVQDAIDGFEGTVEGVSSLGVDTIYSSRLLKAVPWVLIAAAPKSEVFAPLAGAQRRLWIVALGAAAALVPLSWLIVWFMLGPLRHLRASMIGMREGEGEFVPVPVKRTDEVGDLTTAFNLLMRERIGAERAQRESEARLRLIADNMPALISYVDAQHRVQFANSCYREWFGLDPVAMVGQRVEEIFGDPSYRETVQNLDRALTGKATMHEREVDTLSGKRSVRTSFYPRIDEGGAVIGVYHMTTDITADRQREAELHHLARRDSLTGLHNRRSLMELLPAAIARCARQERWIALLFVDLDRFKAVNDTLGHQAGDAVLKAVAERLIDNVRSIDSVARLGGDEFILVLEGLHAPEEAEAVAGKIIEAIGMPIATSTGECTVGASVGIAARHGAQAEVAELLKQADAAAYAAKGAGRGCYQVA